MSTSTRIFVAGARGMVGSALVRRLSSAGYDNLLTPSRAELDLLDGRAVVEWLRTEQPEYIFIAAARVGGILANNNFRADFLQQNLAIELNLIHGAHLAGVERLMFLGSSCIYPRDCAQPIREEYLLTGPLEPTNEPYAIAKIAGIKLAESYNHQYGRSYVSVMPTNLYGPGDNYDLESSHVLPALLRKGHEARLNDDSTLAIWGSGQPRREFLYVEDLADACVFLMETGYRGPLVNIGTSEDVSIADLAKQIAVVTGFSGSFVFDPSKPDGTPRKLLDVTRLTALGWTYRTPLQHGLELTYAAALGDEKFTGYSRV